MQGKNMELSRVIISTICTSQEISVGYIVTTEIEYGSYQR